MLKDKTALKGSSQTHLKTSRLQQTQQL
uniref:Uncharacterized protein n=1 Tax=Anguilla anguilla TaxID=7936 RepID=A0A0E9PJU7_ANGAN